VRKSTVYQGSRAEALILDVGIAGRDGQELFLLSPETYEALGVDRQELFRIGDTEGLAAGLRWLDARGLPYRLTDAGRRELSDAGLRLCAHADQDGRGAHWLASGEQCDASMT
jgi:hypothetical protein